MTTQSRTTASAASSLIGKLALIELTGDTLSPKELADLADEAKPLMAKLLSAAPKREVSTVNSIAATKAALDAITGTDYEASSPAPSSSVLIGQLLKVRSTLIQHREILGR